MVADGKVPAGFQVFATPMSSSSSAARPVVDWISEPLKKTLTVPLARRSAM